CARPSYSSGWAFDYW
nr:immunoglobulin heavy chain junction region [Macaca mulatta]MOY18173.1 immunoglobulin heavy chain junction region [Macaca mulatta]MOY19787.1 immunoglobulin heavy chain junction region [Macaca mulatta]MOY20110.1 immunoglobulin heavy chain junction region [Macaca mulatta]MOY20686.1 immunoglobulin heavy chain junction region [Macaca mulatta]